MNTTQVDKLLIFHFELFSKLLQLKMPVILYWQWKIQLENAMNAWIQIPIGKAVLKYDS